MGMRAELKAACLDLAADLNAALKTAGLPQLAAVIGPDDLDTRKRPRMVVSVAGSRDRTAYTSGRSYSVEERLTVSFAVELSGTEDDALAYEEILLPAIAGAWDDLDTAMTSARLGGWYPTGGALEQDPAGDDERERVVLMEFEATLEWAGG